MEKRHSIITRRWLAPQERIVKCPVCEGKFPEVNQCDICGGHGKMAEVTKWERMDD